MATFGRFRTLACSLLLTIAFLPGAEGRATAEASGADGGLEQCTAAASDASATSPVTGYFTYYESDVCAAEQKMAEVQRSGGDTLITFGFRLEQRKVDARGQVLSADGTPDPRYSCWEGRSTCQEAAVASGDGGTIRRVLTYSGTEKFGREMIRCPRRDRNVLSDGTRFQRILMPVGDDQSCEADADQYDLVLINNGLPTDVNPVENMLVAAQQAHIEMFLGLPKPSTNPASPWLADVTYLDTVERFTYRLLSDWRARYGGLDSFAGLYQAVEMPLKGNAAWDDQYALYGAQHAVAHQVLPELPIMLSPYIDARPRMTAPVEGVPLAIQRMVETGAGAKVIIAPQDGRGTGKGGVFFPDEADDQVDARLVPVVGGPLSYADAYFARSRDYYSAAATAGKAAGGNRFELWANLELMEPSPLTGEPACSPDMGRGRATADRVMKQVGVAGDTVTKLIGFDWDQMMKCDIPGKETLADQLLRLGDHPAPTGVNPVVRDGIDGTRITGYNLADASVTVTYQDTAGEQRSVSFAPGEHQFDQHFGKDRPGDYPAGIQAITLPWRPSAVAPDASWLSVDITTPAGTILYGTFAEAW